MSSKEHILKTIDTVWDAVDRGEKTFEVRLNDRFFQRGDIVVLRRINEDGSYSNRSPDDWFSPRDIRRKIGWMLQGGQFGIDPKYVVFQLEPEEPQQ